LKAISLFQFGGIAVFLSAILTGMGRLIYYLSGQPEIETAPLLWRGIFAGILFLLGFGALFARQSQRGGTLGLVGYVLIVCAMIFFIAEDVVRLGMSAGVITEEQIRQVPSYTLSSAVMPWIWVAGLITFGVSTYRAQVLPKYAGALLVLLGLIQPLTGSLAFTRPIYAVCYFAAWAWLGWDLYARAGIERDVQT
jgi:hypothetical protein